MSAPLAKLIWKNSQAVKKDLDAADKKRVKSAEVATRVEGFRLSKLLKEQIRAGAPGGHRFAPLSMIAKRRNRGAMGRNPLQRLAMPIRSQVERPDGRFNVAVGFAGKKISKSWKRIAELLQQGGSVSMKSGTRLVLRQMGAKLKKRRKPEASKFFIRRSTQRFKVPARPIIDPFWNANRAQARQNIVKNWERKMAGERI